jgi:CRP-like cAMP-binding protein
MSRLSGVTKLLQRHTDQADGSPLSARAWFDVASLAASRTRSDLPSFLRQASLFEDLGKAELARLARIVHERSYGDGEYISEEGKPGSALFVLRSGVLEITKRNSAGEELVLATLEAPASFDELAAVGEVVRWNSVRARGPVRLIALGSSDLDALNANFPALANKILKKLVQITGARLQLLVQSQYFVGQDRESPK